MNVFQIDPIADARWLTFLENTPGASIFHHPVWFEVLRETYGYLPVCLAATEADYLVGVLPLMEVKSWFTGNRAVCLPFSDTCGALVKNGSALQALLRYSEELRKHRKWKYVEIKDSIASDNFRMTTHYKLHRISLGNDTEALFKTLKVTQIQQSIIKAQKLGVLVERRTDQEALRSFIYLNAVTRRKHGVPPQPDSFFRNIAKKIFESGLGFIGTATLDGQIIATALFLHWNNTIIYKYSASDERARSAKASHAILWDTMRWGCEHGFTLFDLGRSDLTNEGLLQFKRGWGSQESDLIYVRHVANINDHANAPSEMLEHLKPLISAIPLPLLKLVGSKLYAHIG
jgi:CelD/BcsL family acetyltransferase involved in cellulose biosynthesis